MDTSLNNDIGSYQNLIVKYPELSAKNLYLKKILLIFYVVLFSIFLLFFLFKEVVTALILLIGSILLLALMLFKIFLTIIGLGIKKERIYCDIGDNTLPVYSILVPLYKEEKVIKYLLRALNKIDYPKANLEIFLLIEEDDHATFKAVLKQKLNEKFKIIIIPFSQPRTKPKACNYGLKYVTGKYVVIYDAEDVPEPTQLKKVVASFESLSDDFVCIQAKLNYFNREENAITKCFSVEYSNWFEFMLPALRRLNLIIPLGGTSNHFKTKKLKEIGAWDDYNVTEDAEIGIRLSLLGYKVALLNSTTYEESPMTFKNWIKQRTRWIKGYLQTYIIFLVNKKKYFKNLSFFQILGFHMFIGLPAFTYFFTPFLGAIFVLSYFEIIKILGSIKYILLFSQIVFVIGIFCSVFITINSVIYHKWYNIIEVIFLFFFYHILHSLASYRAIYQLFSKTYYWEKTEHGATNPRFYKKFFRKSKK